jgi:hypothetical protein
MNLPLGARTALSARSSAGGLELGDKAVRAPAGEPALRNQDRAFTGAATRNDRFERGTPWLRHTIDNSSRGADGVRLADVNKDGLLDIATGWEEGGVVRAYLNPGPARAREQWPAVTVGNGASVEDAVFADLDADGAVDIVSSCEGKVRTMFVHWAPKEASQYLDARNWTTQSLTASKEAMQWMFCLPLQIDGKHGIDLVAGGKEKNAQLGWFEAPANARQLADWKWHPLCNAGWIMSLVASDMDNDGDVDILASDRKGESRGCFWLENPAGVADLRAPWKIHRIGGSGKEVMFLTQADLDSDGLIDVIVAARPREILYLRRMDRRGQNWESHSIALPPNTGGAKAVNAGDLNLDGKLDIAFSCEGATAPKSGVMWLSYRQSPMEAAWDAHEISGSDGVKHDLVQLLDLDGDGDLDLLTCEEVKNLGVFWYENPTIQRR